MDADDTVQAEQQKPKIPVLEKQLIGQLSKEEQDALEAKFKEASEADKKVCSSVKCFKRLIQTSIILFYAACGRFVLFFLNYHIVITLHDDEGNGHNKITFNPKQKMVKI